MENVLKSKSTAISPALNTVGFFNPDGSELKNARMLANLIVGARKKATEKGGSPEARAELQKTVAGLEWQGRRVIGKGSKNSRAPLSEISLSSNIRIADYLNNDFGTIHIRDFGDDGVDGAAIFGTRIDLASVGWYWDAWAEGTDKGRIRKIETYQNTSTSKMGGFLRAENFSPDGRDYISGHAESGFCWGYTPTRDCRLEIRALVTETYSRSRRRLGDQWMQVSNAHVDQGNYLTAGYFSSGIESYGKVFRDVGPSSSYVGDGDHSQDDSSQYGTENSYYGYPDVDVLTRDESRTIELSLVPTGQMYKDRSVTCFIGARSQMFANLDDVTADLWQGGTWKVIDLFVREI